MNKVTNAQVLPDSAANAASVKPSQAQVSAARCAVITKSTMPPEPPPVQTGALATNVPATQVQMYLVQLHVSPIFYIHSCFRKRIGVLASFSLRENGFQSLAVAANHLLPDKGLTALTPELCCQLQAQKFGSPTFQISRLSTGSPYNYLKRGPQ